MALTFFGFSAFGFRFALVFAFSSVADCFSLAFGVAPDSLSGLLIYAYGSRRYQKRTSPGFP